MKRWAVLTTLLYVLVLVVLAAPLLVATFSNWWPTARARDTLSFQEASEMYQQWGFWVWLAIMALGQGLLLFTPIGIAERRPTPRRPLFLPVITTSFFLANLLLAAVLAGMCVLFRDDAFEFFYKIGELAQADASYRPVTNQAWNATTAAGPDLPQLWFGLALALAIFWLPWALIFYRFARADDPATLLKRATRWLLRGSILELLVAVPSHVIVRNRNDCCAPGGTFWGIATGISIMLLCFGPGVFFLFAERFGRLKPKAPSKEAHVAAAPSPPS